jgi:hypothetical protein
VAGFSDGVRGWLRCRLCHHELTFRRHPPVTTDEVHGAHNVGMSWNWLLLVPLVVLVTPLYNHDEPRLLGFPVFYWAQFLCVVIGVACVAMVYLKAGGRR